MSVTRYHGQVSSCTISEKPNNPILWKLSGRWPDGWEWIHRTLSIVCIPPLPFCRGWWDLKLLQNFQKGAGGGGGAGRGGLDRTLIFRGGVGEKAGVTFLRGRGVAIFMWKRKRGWCFWGGIDTLMQINVEHPTSKCYQHTSPRTWWTRCDTSKEK